MRNRKFATQLATSIETESVQTDRNEALRIALNKLAEDSGSDMDIGDVSVPPPSFKRNLNPQTDFASKYLVLGCSRPTILYLPQTPTKPLK